MVRHRAGTIYLRAKVAGKIKQTSLETSDLRIAKLKRDELLDNLRKGAAAESGRQKIRSLGDALDRVESVVTGQPHLRPASVKYYREVFASLRETLPLAVPARSWSAGEARAWWKDYADRFSSQRANNGLGVVKRLGLELVESGARADDPSVGLRRVKITARELNVPPKETIDAIVSDIRRQGKAFSDQAADFVAFLAFAGCRFSQAKALRWEDVGEDWIEFKAGIEGTKGAATRRLPINPALRAVLERLRPTDGGAGPVFTMDRPREALRNACERLGVDPPLRLHDLRHFFASWAIENGIDVPTVSRWLGHKDGGALVMRTYSHLRDDHSKESADRLPG